MATTFDELRAALDSLAGLDLETTDRDALLNRGHRKMAVEAEWYRFTEDIGPTVADQAAYDPPTDFDRIIKIWVGGYQYKRLSEVEFNDLTNATLRLRARGGYYLAFDASGAETVTLYPTPGTAGTAINVLFVKTPALLSDGTDPIVVPDRFAQGIIDYAASIAYGMGEDNPDMRAYHKGLYEEATADLAALRRLRAGRNVGQARIAPFHL